MFHNRLFKLFVSLALTIALLFLGIIPGVGDIHPAYAANRLTISTTRDFSSAPLNSSTDWYQVDQYLIDAIRSAHDSTEEFAASELENWVDELMKKVDDKFLNWYFSYFNQKAMEFGVPFAWLTLKIDVLNKFKKKDEAHLTANEILQKRMIEDFEKKFKTLVLKPEDAKQFLMKLAERVGRNYASALGMKLVATKNVYKIPDEEWKRYLNELATVVYDTGNSQSSLSPESITSKLTNEVLIVATAGIGGKLALNFAAKAAGKIATKAGGAIAAKVGSQLLDPILAVGILIWDTWDYKRMVKESKPALRQNILDYLNEVKWSILYAPENSIMAAIDEVEGSIISGLESHLTS